MRRAAPGTSALVIGGLVATLATAEPATAVDATMSSKAATGMPTQAPTNAPTNAPDPRARPVADPASKAAPQRLDLSPPVLKSAIAAADADWTPSHAGGDTFGTTTSSPQGKIDRSFEAAQIESCGGPAAFKFDPPTLGPIGFGGLFAMPFLLHAMATGRCRF